MSGYEQGGEAPSAGAAAAPAPTAGEGQESEEIRDLKAKINTLETKINTLETKIAADEADVKTIGSEAVLLKRLELLAEDKKRLRDMEAERTELRHEIKQLLAPAEQPTAAGGSSPTLCLLLRSRIGLPRRGSALAPLATRT